MYKTFVLLPVVVLVAGCGTATTPNTNPTSTAQSSGGTSQAHNTSTDTFTYNDGGLNVEVASSEKPITQFLPTAVQLAAMSGECGTNHSAAYYQKLLAKFDVSSIAKQYTFSYKQAHHTFTVIPNVLGYRNMIDFKGDFEVCAVGGNFPEQVSEQYLLFASACPTADGGDQAAVECEQIIKTIDPTIKFK